MKITIKEKMVKVTVYDSKKHAEDERITSRPNKIKDLTNYFQKECVSDEVVLKVEELPILTKRYDIPDEVLEQYEVKEGE